MEKAEIINELVQKDLLYFIPAMTKEYASPYHLKPFINILQKILFGKPQHVLFLVPPRHGKTETVLHFISLYLKHYPQKQVGYVSYATRQATSKTLKAQRYCQSIGIAEDKREHNKSDWKTEQGGGIYTTGMGGALTGQGIDLLIIDDPVKNIGEAESITYRERAWDWFENVAETRLEPNASVIVIMTRWHEDDLGGRIIARRKNYTCMRVPALADNLDVLGKYPMLDMVGRKDGEALWSKRYNEKYLNEINANKPFVFTALYQGLPRRKEDRLFQGVTYYKELPKDGYLYSIGADLAYTQSTRADYTVIVTFLKKGEYDYVVDVQRFQEEIGYTKRQIKTITDKYNTKAKIEANGTQKAVYDMLKSERIKVEPVIPKGDKYVRALPFAEAWNAGKVLLPDPSLNKEWLEPYIEEVTNFTGINDVNDDQVDASVYAHQGKKKTRIINWD